MNELHLFRGRAGFKEWHYGAYNEGFGYPAIMTKDGNYSVDPATLGLCAGLRDKNGKLIFEGDIVEATLPSYQAGKNEPTGKYTTRGIVSYMFDAPEKRYQYAPRWCVEKSLDSRGIYVSRELWAGINGWQDGWEVVGNIHDNPELMEVPHG